MEKHAVTTNAEQRLFVIPCGTGYSCFGFDNCYRESRQIAERIARPDLLPKKEEIGELKQYEQYQKLVSLFGQSPARYQTWFDSQTPESVRNILESAIHSGKRLRIFYGDSKTGRDWLEEHDVVGSIGRSSGTMKIPLMIANSRSSGGCGLLDSSIVRIIDCETKRQLYCHPAYHQPVFELVENEHPDYPATVKTDGKVHARFKTRNSADRWLAYMKGERMAK